MTSVGTTGAKDQSNTAKNQYFSMAFCILIFSILLANISSNHKNSENW
jgi:hypothetical protein